LNCGWRKISRVRNPTSLTITGEKRFETTVKGDLR
jgi:hypothetical protein